jgi:DNA repair protein RadD
MLRDYQRELKTRIMALLRAGERRAVIGVLPTGGGKTVIMADIFREFPGASCAIAHRQELVSQISLAMARAGVVHKLIAPKDIIRWIVSQHVETFGRSFYDPRSIHAVAGIDTLIKHQIALRDWARQVSLWEIDEGHHIREDNKWGKAVKLFENAVGIGWTATPLRSDKKALKVGEGGVFHDIVVGPTMRDLIKQGFLSDYRIFGPPESIDLSGVQVTASGDFNPQQLRAAARKSKIVGDIVDHYLRLAPGKLGVTFTVDVDSAEETAATFRERGVSAAVVSANTPADQRVKIIKAFRNREILQIVNVDIFGEGFDCPAIEVCSMGRPTESYGLFVQQFGRALRPLEGKSHGIIIDHVGNFERLCNQYGLPDAPHAWSLDAPPKRKRNSAGMSDAEKHVRMCTACFQPFEAWKRTCPHCGNAAAPGRRDKPEFVEGDLTELDPAVLEKMRQEAEDRMKPAPFQRGDTVKSRKTFERWNDRARAQNELRLNIARWAGFHTYNLRMSDSDTYRLFYKKFGIDVASAKLLGSQQARDLSSRLDAHIAELRGAEASHYELFLRGDDSEPPTNSTPPRLYIVAQQ